MPQQPGDDALGRLHELLSSYYLGEFDLRLCNVTCATIVRETSRRGLNCLEQSVRKVGWLPQFAPSVVIESSAIPEEGLSAESALDLEVRVLDGNHRVKTCRKVFGADSTIRCLVYKTLRDAEDERLIADCE